MRDSKAFEVATDTGQFTPDQLQPTTIVSLGMQGWAQWLRRHLVPFPVLVHEHHIGVVVVTLSIAYEEPFRFADAPTFRVTSRVADRGRGRMLGLAVRFTAGRRVIARSEALLRVVALGSDASLAGAPGRLPPVLLRRLPADERQGPIERRVKSALASLEAREPEATGRSDFVLHRHLCEVADQWNIVLVPSLANAARERLLLGSGASASGLSRGLGRPLRRLDIDLRQPLFLFDDFWIDTAAHATEPMRFVHRVSSPANPTPGHATIVETLG